MPATLDQLQGALARAQQAGDTQAVELISNRIKEARVSSAAGDPFASRAATQAERFGIFMQDQAAAEAPSAAGSFFREGGRSVAPGIGGFFSGAATGAGLGALGANPFTVGAGAIVGGLAGALGIRMGQDKLADAVAPDSFMGTASAGRDFQHNPIASLLGGAVAQARPSMAAFRTVGNLASSEGRGLIAQGMKQGASAPAQAAFRDAMDAGLGAGIGAGMSAATDDGMMAENAAIGAIFAKPWLGPRLRPHGEPAPEPNTNTGLIPAEPLRGPVTRMGSSQLDTYSPPVVWNQPKLPGPRAEAPRLPAPEQPPAGRLPGAAQERLPAPTSEYQTPDMVGADYEANRRSIIESLQSELVNNRVRYEQVKASLQQRGVPLNEGEGRRALALLDNRAVSLLGKIENLQEGLVRVPQQQQPRPIVEVDNRPLGAKPGDRLPLPAPPPARQPRQPFVGESGPVIEADGPFPEMQARAEAEADPAYWERQARPAEAPPAGDKVAAFRDELAMNGVAYDGEARYAIRQSSDGDTFYVERTVNGDRQQIAHGFDSIADAQAAAVRALSEPAAKPATPEVADRTAEVADKPSGGMSIEEGKAYLARRGEESILGYSPDDIMRMQQGQRPTGRPSDTTPAKPASHAQRTREILDAIDQRDSEYHTLREIRRLGGIKAPPKGMEIAKANRDRQTRSAKGDDIIAANRPWEGAPRAVDFDPVSNEGKLAGEVLARVWNHGEDARTPDQMAEQLGIDVPTLWQRVRGELDTIHRSGGDRQAQQDAIMETGERQLVAFEEAVDAVPNADKGEAGYLNKGDRFEIDGEPVKVIKATDDTVTLKDGDRFGVQTVDRDKLIPMENLKPAAKKAAADEGFALEAHESDADIIADKKAIAKRNAELAAEKEAADAPKREMNEGIAKRLTGDTGDTTRDMFTDPRDDDMALFGRPKPKPADAEDRTFLDALKAHSQRVGESINKSKREGRLNMVIPGLDPVTAKTIYKLALDTAIKTFEAGQTMRKAITAGLDAIKAAGRKLTDAQLSAVKAALYSDIDAHRVFAGKRDAQIKVEIARLRQVFAAKGIASPSRADILKALTSAFPDEAARIRKNFDRLLDEVAGDLDSFTKSGNKEWNEWLRATRDRTARFLDDVRRGASEYHALRALRQAHDTIFTGIATKAINLANGAYGGKQSKALQDYFAKRFGVKPGKDGVNRMGDDIRAEIDINRRLNELDNFDQEITKILRGKGMDARARRAWRERIVEHMIDPSRDAELAKQPELKKAVDFFLKRRRERLEFMRKNNVDVGDAGERSASRMIDPVKVIANRSRFITKAAAAYKRKWAREIATLQAEMATLKKRGGKGDYERYEKLSAEVEELRKLDPTRSAEEYFDAIVRAERGDSKDFFKPEGGHKADMVKNREFGAEADELLGDFMFRDAIEQDMHETTAAVRQVTRARFLASKDASGKIDPVGQWKELRAALKAEGNEDMLPQVQALLEGYLNLGGAKTETGQKLMEWAHGITQLAYLSRAGISNLGEPVLIGLRSGSVGNMLKAYQVVTRNLVRRLRGLPPNEAQAIANGLGVAKGGFNSIMGGIRLNEAFEGRGTWGKLVSSFHVKTLLTDITAAMHEASVEIGRGYLHTQVRLAKLAGSKNGALAKRNLNELGVSMDDVDALHAFIDKLEKAPDASKVIFADTPEAALYRDAVALFNRTGGVLDPTRGSRAQLANTPVGSLFYSLQSFLYEFQNKVVMRHLRRAGSAISGKMDVEGTTYQLTGKERGKIAAEIATGASAIFAAQFAVQLIREFIYTDPERIAKDQRRTAGERMNRRLLATFSRTGVLGPYDLLFNMVSGARFDRDPATVVLGPAVGGASELFKALVTQGGDKDSPNTNTAERKLARAFYNMTIAPAAGAALSTLPGYFVPTIGIQSAYHPMWRERFVKSVAGPPKLPKPKGSGGPLKW